MATPAIVQRFGLCTGPRLRSMLFESKTTEGERTFEDPMQVVQKFTKNMNIRSKISMNISYNAMNETKIVLNEQTEETNYDPTEITFLQRTLLTLEDSLDDIEQYSRRR